MSIQKFQSGEVFFRPGDSSEAAYLLESGRVQIIFGDPSRPVRVVEMGPGDVFGEMALVEERPHSATARALSDGTATRMSREEFEHDLLQEPARGRAYIRSLFERLRQLSSHSASEHEAAPPPAALRVAIHPLTHKSAETLPDAGLPVPHFPFRIGRATEANEREPLDLNDLWLLDEKPFNVSRNHLAIDRDADGHLVVNDRGSFLGSIVNEAPVGGRSPRQSARLVEGDNVLILGGAKSPYQFRVQVQKA